MESQEEQLKQKIADTIVTMMYCKKHWYYPWCAMWLIRAKYIKPVWLKLGRWMTGENERNIQIKLK